MGQKTCGPCGGTGGHHTTEKVPNPAGGMFQMRQVRITCAPCGGSGRIWIADPPPPPHGAPAGSGRVTPGADGQLRAKATPEEKDKGFALLTALATGGYVGYLAFFEDLEAETWVKWMITLVPAAGVYWCFLKYTRVTRVLRIATGVAILAVIAYYAIVAFVKYG